MSILSRFSMKQLNGIDVRMDTDLTESECYSKIDFAQQFHQFASLE